MTSKAVPGVAVAGQGGGVLLDPRGVPIFSSPGVPLDASPLRGEEGVQPTEVRSGGRVAPWPGGPWIGATDARDPVTGDSTGATALWPWVPRGLESASWDPPWPEPDDAARELPWDPAPWAATSPWGDPLTLLVTGGQLPQIDPGLRLATWGEPAVPGEDHQGIPGLPLLPASLAPVTPILVHDPDAIPLPEDPIVRWVLAQARDGRPGAGPGCSTAARGGRDLGSWLAGGDLENTAVGPLRVSLDQIYGPAPVE